MRSSTTHVSDASDDEATKATNSTAVTTESATAGVTRSFLAAAHQCGVDASLFQESLSMLNNRKQIECGPPPEAYHCPEAVTDRWSHLSSAQEQELFKRQAAMEEGWNHPRPPSVVCASIGNSIGDVVKAGIPQQECRQQACHLEEAHVLQDPPEMRRSASSAHSLSSRRSRQSRVSHHTQQSEQQPSVKSHRSSAQPSVKSHRTHQSVKSAAAQSSVKSLSVSVGHSQGNGQRSSHSGGSRRSPSPRSHVHPPSVAWASPMTGILMPIAFGHSMEAPPPSDTYDDHTEVGSLHMVAEVLPPESGVDAQGQLLDGTIAVGEVQGRAMVDSPSSSSPRTDPPQNGNSKETSVQMPKAVRSLSNLLPHALKRNKGSKTGTISTKSSHSNPKIRIVGIPSADESSSTIMTNKKYICGLCIAVLLAVVVLGIAAGLSEGTFMPRNNSLVGQYTSKTSEPTMPVPVPTKAPPLAPSDVPSAVPSPLTTASFVPSPMPSPYPTTTLAPTRMSKMRETALALSSSAVLEDSTSAQYRALQWLEQQDQLAVAGEFKLAQRYVITVLDFAFHPTATNVSLGNAETDECQWPGITCAQSKPPGLKYFPVESVNWANRTLSGEIPEEIGVLKWLVTLDLGENAIEGTIPASIYDLFRLEYLYLHQNWLSGNLSPSVSKLRRLIRLYLGDNQLSGSLPTWADNPSPIYHPLRILNLHKNNFSGTLPSGLELPKVIYLDLSANSFTGSFPADWISTLKNVKVLNVDHNELSGELPPGLLEIGSEQVVQVALNDNEFNGTSPSVSGGNITVLHIEGNKFIELGEGTCESLVWWEGQLASFRADPEICLCKWLC